MTPEQATAKVKEIAIAFCKYWSDHTYFSFQAAYDNWLEESTAQTLVDSLAGVGGEDWISVKDRLPAFIDPTGIESGELSVKFKDGSKGCAWLHVDKGWCAWGKGRENLPVTHWKNE